MTLFILPASAFMYASGSPENSERCSGSTDTSGSGSSDGSGSTENSGSGSSDGSGSTENSGSGSSDGSGSTENSGSGSSDGSGSTENSGSGSSDGSGSTENNTALSTSPAENNAGLPIGPTVSNNTGNVYCATCNDDIYNGGGDFASMILAGHNRERAALSLPPLAWDNEMAARAQDWAEYQLANGLFTHCIFVKGWEQIESCPHQEGENGAQRPHCHFISSDGTCSVTNVPMAQMQEGWFSEKPIDHWLQVVSKTAKSIGCASATGPIADSSGRDRDILVCRYSPPGIDVPGITKPSE